MTGDFENPSVQRAAFMRVNPFFAWRVVGVLSFAFFQASVLAILPGWAASKDAIFSSTIVVAAIVPQPLTVAKAESVSIGTATVAIWMSTATAVFQLDNSTQGMRDIACPVRVYLDGVSISTFTSAHDELRGPSDKEFLYSLPEWVTIVKATSYCGGFFDIYSGCTQIGGANGHLVINEVLANITTFAHEFLHLNGSSRHLACVGNPPCDEMHYVVYKNDDANAAMNILSADDCRKLQGSRTPRP